MNKGNFLPFDEALVLVRKLAVEKGVNCQSKWREAHHLGVTPENIPFNPDRVYKNKGWVSWRHWVNGEEWRDKPRKAFLPFEEARKIVNELNFKNTNQYREWLKKSKLETIPSNPHLFYKGKGWVSYGDWLGTNNIFHQSKYIINDHFFKTWSKDMAYVLGFWFADGCISKHGNGYGFTISQNVRDILLMKKILNAMGASHPLYYRPKSNSVNITIYSQEICNDIFRLGGKERKSLDVKWPDIPDEYLPDFIRGFFDGDGCITRNKESKRSFTALFTGGSLEFLTGLEGAIRRMIPSITDNIPRGRGIYIKKRSSGNYWDLFLRGICIIRLGEYIYRDFDDSIISMPRKRDKFILAKEIINDK